MYMSMGKRRALPVYKDLNAMTTRSYEMMFFFPLDAVCVQYVDIFKKN